MLRSNWHIGLAFIVALILGFATWHCLRPNISIVELKQVSASEGYNSVGCSQDDFRRIKSNSRRRVRESNCAESAYQHKYNQDTLDRATSAAVSANKANELSFKQTQAAAFQSAALIFTLIIAAWAAIEARGAVNATREVGRDQSRSYVHVDLATLKWGNEGTNPQITLTVRNTGGTPAKWFSAKRIVFTTPKDAPIDAIKFTEIDFTNKNEVRWPALGSNATLTFSGAISEDFDVFQEAYRDGLVLNVAGIITYETIFNEIYESEYWFVSRPPHRPHRDTRNIVVIPESLSDKRYRPKPIPEKEQIMPRTICPLRVYEKKNPT